MTEQNAAMRELASEISKKQESLHHAKQAKSTGTNRDLLSEITDNFHTEHGAHRAAVETRYQGGSALNPKIEGDDPATPKGAVPEEAFEEYDEERRTGARRAAPAADTAEFTAAAADLYKKHEALRTTGAPVELKGGNKDLLSDITDSFLKDHLAERAAVETRYDGSSPPPAGPPAIGRVSATGLHRKSATPFAAAAAAPAGPPRINRNSMGAVENKEMASAAGALAAKHEEMRSEQAKQSRAGGPSHDLLSEVTDTFMKEHIAHRANVDTQNMATAPAPTFTPTPQAPSSANAIRRASMGSVPLVTVPEKSPKSKDGFMKKLGRLFSGEPTNKMKPKLQAQSMHVISAVTDIGERSRQLTRTSVTSAGSGSATPSAAPPKSAGSGADMLGTLCDEWHDHNAANTAGASGYKPSPMPTNPHGSQVHDQLEY